MKLKCEHLGFNLLCEPPVCKESLQKYFKNISQDKKKKISSDPITFQSATIKYTTYKV